MRSDHFAASLPLVQVIRDKDVIKKTFPHMTDERGIYLAPLKNLELMNTAGRDDAAEMLITGFAREYIRDKSTFRSIDDFAVIKLNEVKNISFFFFFIFDFLFF